MKSILLHIYDDENLPSRVQVALDLAREFDAHLTCLQAVSYEVSMPGDIYGATAAAALPVIREAAEELREKLEEQLKGEDVAWDWIFEHGMSETRLLEYAVLQDMTVVGDRDLAVSGDRPSRLVGLLATHSRTPVLVVPQAANGMDVDTPAMVGWNGSPEAANALRSSLPLLKRAPSVFLASVEEERKRDHGISAQEAASYLSRHDVHCEVVELPRSEEGIAHTLTEAARARSAGCVVIGAYGHSRLREMIFGGVTHSMLANVQVPLLMAH